MLFQSLPFLWFFFAVFSAVALAGKLRMQLLILFAASIAFYAFWEPSYCLILLSCLACNYFAALRIDSARGQVSKKIWLFCACTVNIGLLCFFKYYNFFAGSLNEVSSMLGLSVTVGLLDVLLPVGISFYTFISLGYVIDVYRGACRPEKWFPRFALLPSFFPIVLSGPVLRANDFFSQLRVPVRPDKQNITIACNLFLQGLVKKVLVADQIAPLADYIFENPQGLPSIVIIIGAITFGVQIYCDFSGYTDMALGVARAMGYRLPKNFNYPYFAASFGDFWKRWHMSLSSWLRDYVYIPLGGNRKGRRRTYCNLLATMGLCGLWHGASWNFVLWGIYHGMMLMIERAFAPRKEVLMPGVIQTVQSPGWGKLKKIAVTVVVQYFVFLGWMIFRVKNPGDIVYCVKKYVFFDCNFNIASLGLGNTNPFLAAFTLLLFGVAHSFAYKYGAFAKRVSGLSMPKRIVFYVAVVFVVIILWPTENASFIYFQF